MGSLRHKYYFGGQSQIVGDNIYDGFNILISINRKLNPYYTGKAFRLKRLATNEEMDIGFVGSEIDSAT